MVTRTTEFEAEGSQVRGQPELHGKILFQDNIGNATFLGADFHL